MADGTSGDELQTLRQEVAALHARVEALAARGGEAERPERTGPPSPQAETEAGAQEEADVARVAPKPGEMVGIGEGAAGRTTARRVPLSSLGGSGRSLPPLSYDVGTYLTRLLHRAKRALPGTISEVNGNEGQAPLSIAGDAGLLAIQTATEGTPPRLQVYTLPFVHPAPGDAANVEQWKTAGADAQSYAEKIAADLEPLASAPRLTLLLSLRQAPRSSTELQQGLGLAPGQLYHHLKPLANAGFLRRDDQGRYAISGRGRRALMAAQLLSSEVSHGRFEERLERVSEAEGDARQRVYASERSTEVPLDSGEASAEVGA